MPRLPKPLDPDDFRLPEFFEAFYPFKLVSDDASAIMDSKPVVEGNLSPRPGNFDMLPQTNFDGFGRKAYIAIDDLRPEPDPIDHVSGRKFGRQEILLSVTSCHNMQLTQPSTSVPSKAIWRKRM
jgi:hypothetical protein